MGLRMQKKKSNRPLFRSGFAAGRNGACGFGIVDNAVLSLLVFILCKRKIVV